MEKLLTIRQTSEKYGMSQSLYRKAIRLNQIEYVKVGKAVRLTESAIKDFFDKNSRTISA